jgi:hypothetical protein
MAASQIMRVLRQHAFRKLTIWLSANESDIATSPTITSGSGAPSASEPNGSKYLRTNGAIYTRVGGAWVADADAGAAISDTNTYFTTDTVDGALDAIALQLGGATDATYNFTDNHVLADNDAVYAALNKLDTAIGKYVPLPIADPGTGAAIPVTRSVSVPITTAAAETNTLAIPAFVGQKLHLVCDVYAVGDRVITSAQRINQAGNTIMTFGAAGDFIALEAVQIGGALRWQVTHNDGVALS